MRECTLIVGVLAVAAIVSLNLIGQPAQARTYIVNGQAPRASDENAGTEQAPLRTIQAAADRAVAGDVVLVRAGIYREWVKPRRSGTAVKPITFKAAPGEHVSIRGSERIANWQDQGGGVWMVELDTAFFKGYNPFAMPVWGAWLHRGRDRRLGDVYLNGEALLQKMQIEQMKVTPMTWYTDLSLGYTNRTDFPEDRQYPDGKVRIWANFGEANPNEAITEINARPCAIFPRKAGLKYIVIDGFDIRHVAPQWADIYWTEYGAVGTRLGYGWTIQNCTIAYSRNVGVSLGVTDEVHFPRPNEGGLLEGGSNIPPYDTIGHHIIRSNRMTRCGQCGIYGCYGAVGSVIEGNLITDMVYRNEWMGSNQAAIKILFPIDVIIRDNLILGAEGDGGRNAKGIWLDWGSQNTRVTGNIIHGFGGNRGLFLEVNFGPVIVDNNVISASDVVIESNGCVIAHNLFHDCRFHFMASPKRIVPYFKPHSTRRAGTAAVSLIHNRVFNNLVVGGQGFASEGLVRDGVDVSDTHVDHNVYLNGAGAFPGKDERSIVMEDPVDFQVEINRVGAEIQVDLPASAFAGQHFLITAEQIGKIPLANMWMQQPDGQPLNLTSDFFGRQRAGDTVKPGPFHVLRPGAMTIRLWPKAP